MLITMAVHDTPENERRGLTLRTLDSLAETVDWGRHRFIICCGARRYAHCVNR